MSLSENLMDLKEVVEANQGLIIRAQAVQGQLVLWCAAEKLPELVQFLRNDSAAQCSQLMDITAIDYPGANPRFVVVYQLLSLKLNLRVRLKL